MGLAEEIAAVHAHEGDPQALVGEFRRAVLLVPVAGGGLMTAVTGGVRWIYAFTGEESLARFARARDAPPDEPWEYLELLGARLTDAVIPDMDGPAGVAVDVADEGAAMLFPPARGIVPDDVAVDVGVAGEGRSGL
ncbi:SseB family protein [Streptomyces sp. JJ36]|uniref:SseB family protein n=1 Tax=Streptomyces sp. JJ36 TaxID=2736645 RepID=UPI001F2130CB|nr:SseB family protein [Streptomyces sp. JJ36]MCF6525061.1 hypothetical protein [Streptomyces sp. JJ36]